MRSSKRGWVSGEPTDVLPQAPRGPAPGVSTRSSTVVALRSALERTERNLLLAVNGHPVRDMDENLAENRAALRMDT